MSISAIYPIHMRAFSMARHPMILMGLACCIGCGGSGDHPPKAPVATYPKPARTEAKPPEVSRKIYKLVGVVKGVNAESKEVRIRHEEIPGFMGAMTMPFAIRDPDALKDVRVGDKVQGNLVVEQEGDMVKDYSLTDLEVTEPAEMNASRSDKELSVSFAGGSPSLRLKPKTLEVGEEVPDFTMTDQDGKSFKLSDLRGNVVALTFVYTRCPLPDFCPMMDRKFSELAGRIERSPRRKDRVRLVSVSFDPEHDTPAVLKKHASMRGASPPLWTYAVASHQELARIAPRVGLVYGPGRDEIIHNLCTAIVGPDGRLARIEIGTGPNKWDATDMLRTIDSFLGKPDM